MIELVKWIGILLVSLIVLVRSASHFTDSASRIGLFLGMPAFIIGVTIVAIGTSLPELISSIIAVVQGASEIAVGNVVGSNIANILLIFGFAAVVGKRIHITRDISIIDLPLLITSSFFLAITVWDGKFTFFEAILSVAAFIVFMFYSISTRRKIKFQESREEASKFMEDKKVRFKDISILITSVFFIFISAKFSVDSVINIAKLINVGTETIAVTAVALGTSLPELVVTIVAARKKHLEIVAGNILGSNIFNALAVMGTAGFFGTIAIPQPIITFAIPFMIISTLLFYFMTQEREMTDWEGAFLLILYVLFIGEYIQLVF